MVSSAHLFHYAHRRHHRVTHGSHEHRIKLKTLVRELFMGALALGVADEVEHGTEHMNMYAQITRTAELLTIARGLRVYIRDNREEVLAHLAEKHPHHMKDTSDEIEALIRKTMEDLENRDVTLTEDAHEHHLAHLLIQARVRFSEGHPEHLDKDKARKAVEAGESSGLAIVEDMLNSFRSAEQSMAR